ncbi:pyridoxal phosphate-dependent transferase [Kalaharituber pfeilii]|nr:pyridoxal phosphate-dependent transferase [Kalaharituber pfeilii]
MWPIQKEDISKLGYNAQVETTREREYPFLQDVTYLDHSGTTLYPTSFIDQSSTILKSQIFGNPHSGSPSSMLATKHVEDVRKQILRFLNANENDWDVVFVANATAGVKLVAEAFQGAAKLKGKKGFKYRYHRDAHTSLIGARELSQDWKCYWSDEEVEEWLGQTKASRSLRCLPWSRPTSRMPCLFAYPAQSNLTGRRLPLRWAQLARDRHGYFTLLDAAAYLMTRNMDLGDLSTAPDYVTCSWYKVFGMPDVGSLIVKKGSAANILRHRAFFGGGTVNTLLAGNPHHSIKAGQPHEGLEDGTVPFHSIIMLGVAMRQHQEIHGGLDRVGKHTGALALCLYEMLSNLRHGNGVKVVEFYSTPKYLDTSLQGPVLSFNLKDMRGEYIGYLEVEKRASEEQIHIRTGGNCNPGGVQWYCGLEESELKRMFESGEKACSDNVDLVRGKPVGLVRVSLGAMSTWDDIYTFGEFVKRRWVDGGQGVAQ